ncbi:lactonase family protein [Cyclobacterium jeungdonense]|uniref:Lactonase family protein n=1 Tax=Cyclobacterium jeungdonense TaxID=708087 RepID=A0ABT8CAV8_9BACT|nr:lactonase family protein [Cyclobacterium jeungdonense]MDN3689099.1 lactonase family protein [Cyclobacterium jeungdonense]
MNRSNLLVAALLFLFLACGTRQTKEEENKSQDMSATYVFLLGTYTDLPEQGIHLAGFSPENGFEVLATASEPENPSFVIANKNQNLIFTVEETSGAEGGKVSGFQLAKNSISKINTVSAAGNSPCYLSLDPSEKFLVVGNYSQGNFSVIPVANDGHLKPAIQVVQHEGSSVNPGRQKQPHVHSTVFHPKDGKLFVADLGTDEVVVYNFDSQKEKPLDVNPHFRLQVAPGAGPRHMVFNENGDRLYLVHEITAEIGVYQYNEGTLKHLETHSLLQEGFEGTVGAAEVRLSPDGKHVYVSNRGDANEIIGFAVAPDGGLKHIQTLSSEGEAPRNFNITPDGTYVLVGNQNSNTLLAFERDARSGLLSATGHQLDIHKPVYINFLP